MGTTSNKFLAITFTLAVYTPPQILAACLAGWLAKAVTKRRTIEPE